MSFLFRSVTSSSSVVSGTRGFDLSFLLQEFGGARPFLMSSDFLCLEKVSYFQDVYICYLPKP